MLNTVRFLIHGIIKNKHRILAKSKGHAGIKPLLCSMLEHSSVINTWFSTPKTARNPGHANNVLNKTLHKEFGRLRKREAPASVMRWRDVDMVGSLRCCFRESVDPPYLSVIIVSFRENAQFPS